MNDQKRKLKTSKQLQVETGFKNMSYSFSVENASPKTQAVLRVKALRGFAVDQKRVLRLIPLLYRVLDSPQFTLLCRDCQADFFRQIEGRSITRHGSTPSQLLHVLN